MKFSIKETAAVITVLFPCGVLLFQNYSLMGLIGYLIIAVFLLVTLNTDVMKQDKVGVLRGSGWLTFCGLCYYLWLICLTTTHSFRFFKIFIGNLFEGQIWFCVGAIASFFIGCFIKKPWIARLFQYGGAFLFQWLTLSKVLQAFPSNFYKFAICSFIPFLFFFTDYLDSTSRIFLDPHGKNPVVTYHFILAILLEFLISFEMRINLNLISDIIFQSKFILICTFICWVLMIFICGIFREETSLFQVESNFALTVSIFLFILLMLYTSSSILNILSILIFYGFVSTVFLSYAGSNGVEKQIYEKLHIHGFFSNLYLFVLIFVSIESFFSGYIYFAIAFLFSGVIGFLLPGLFSRPCNIITVEVVIRMYICAIAAAIDRGGFSTKNLLIMLLCFLVHIFLISAVNVWARVLNQRPDALMVQQLFHGKAISVHKNGVWVVIGIIWLSALVACLAWFFLN